MGKNNKKIPKFAFPDYLLGEFKAYERGTFDYKFILHEEGTDWYLLKDHSNIYILIVISDLRNKQNHLVYTFRGFIRNNSTNASMEGEEENVVKRNFSRFLISKKINYPDYRWG